MKTLYSKDCCRPLLAALISISFLFTALSSQAASDQAASQRESDQGSADRFALLVGNSEYLENALVNPVVDVHLIGDQLRGLGFDVTIVENVSADEIDDSVESFSERARDASLRLFYYSGHGTSHERKEYLLPVDFDFNKYLEDDRDVATYLDRKSISLSGVLHKLEKSRKGSNVLMFDACRTIATPGLRGVSRVERITGASSSSARPDTLFFYSTKHETAALDGIPGDCLLYTSPSPRDGLLSRLPSSA